MLLQSQYITKAKTYAEELKTKYPDDALTDHARILMGEESQSASAEQIASEQNRNTAEQELALKSYPNPFNPSTQIRYSIKDAGYVSLKVYDLLGREVAVLVDEEKQPGAFTIEWNAGHLPSGMYFSRLESSGRAIIQKLLLVR
ncbi:MAG: T9SS type A sorting domain-containing protein [Ignavibacteriae bacterium]|nr:T9SS type A sorting domain-containing protein [Ignavibacteriota bacterium]